MMHIQGHFVHRATALLPQRSHHDEDDPLRRLPRHQQEEDAEDGDQESYLGDQSPVFVAVCSPLLSATDKNNVSYHNTLIYHTIHRLDMTYMEISEK